MRWFVAPATAVLLAVWPASAPRAETGEAGEDRPMTLLRVSSSPPGAEVTVDGHPCGRTPALVEVAPGRHEVVVALGEARATSAVIALDGQTVELAVALPAPWPEPEARPAVPAPPAPQRGEPERATRAGRLRAREPEPRGPEPPAEPWVRRVPVSSFVDLQLYAGAVGRSFRMPIDELVDFARRTEIGFEGEAVGLLGFRVAVYPVASARSASLRGIGFEGGYGAAIGMRVVNQREGEEVVSGYHEADAGMVYRLALGRPEAGATLVLRAGWHRTDFYLGEAHNDLLPPFTYDTVRLGAGVRVPLGTRHLLAEAHASYLAVAGIQGARDRGVLEAYTGAGDYGSHGGEVTAGLAGRLGALELGLYWVGRWLGTSFEGAGQGWGTEPTTRVDLGGAGIVTTGAGADSYQQFRLALTYRI